MLDNSYIGQGDDSGQDRIGEGPAGSSKILVMLFFLINAEYPDVYF